MRKNYSKIHRFLIVGMTLFVGLGAVGSGLFLRPASAACAAPSVNYGTATMKLQVDKAGDYRIWTRMMAPDATNNSLLLEVDGGSCYVVGDGGIAANAWTWVNHQNGTTTNKITATLSAGTHTIKLIGREPSVKVDRVLAVSDQACTPTNFGDNCMVQADTTKPVVDITAPADGSTVSGSVVLKANASDSSGISKVEFYGQDKLLGTDTSAPYEYTWDVSGVANGTVTVVARAYDVPGNTSADSQALVVKNGAIQPPAAPTDLKAKADTYDKVMLSWKASSGAANYRVVRNNVVVATVQSPSYTDTAVTAATSYSYYVVALDNQNNASGPSSAVQVTTPKPSTADTTPPAQPTDLSATAIGTSQINLAWKASTDNVGVKEYDIYRNSDEDKTFRKVATTANTNYGDGGVYDNTTFTYYIIARDAAGNQSPASAKAAALTPKLAEQPTSTLRGTVQGNNGRPLAGVKVTIWAGNTRYQATTNWRGRYILTNIPAGRYEVTYKKNGFDRSTSYVRLSPGKTKWEDATLRR